MSAPLSYWRIVYWCAISFLAGVALCEYLAISWLWIGTICWIGVLIGGILRKRALLLGLCVIALSCGMARMLFAIPTITDHDIYWLRDKGTQSFVGVITKEPDVRETNQKLTVFVDGAVYQGNTYSGTLLVQTKPYPWFSVGDRISFKCKPQEPASTGSVSYRDFLANQGIFTICYNPTGLEITDRASQKGIFGYVFGFKKWIIDSFGRELSEPHSTLLAGIVFGGSGGLPKEVADNFSQVGLTHIVAVSGYNITIVMVAMASILGACGLSRKRATWVIMGSIAMFTIFTGAPSSALRAALMGCIVLLARHTGRTHAIGHTILCTALLMVLYEPSVLLHDAGFQLSFLATYGLVYGTPMLQRLTDHLFLPHVLKDILNQTLAATIATAPLIAVQFEKLSLISILANLLVLPVIPLSMAIGMSLVAVLMIGWAIGLVTPLWHMLIVAPLSWGAWLVLQYVLSVTALLSSLPYASISINLGTWSWVFFVVSYSLLAWMVLMYRRVYGKSERLQPPVFRFGNVVG